MKRNSGRVFFVTCCVSFAAIASIWMFSFLKAFSKEIEKAVANTNTGIFQLQEINYSQTTDSSTPRILTQKEEENLARVSLGYSPELIFTGNILTPEGAAFLEILGISPKHHRHIMPLAEKMVQGEFLNGEEEDAVVIGQELARIFNYRVGDQIVLNYQDLKGQLSSEILVIKGIFDFNSLGFQKKHIYITQKAWKNLYLRQIPEGLMFNRITILTQDLSSRSYFEEKFKNSGLVLKSWKDLNPELSVMDDFQMAIIKFFFVMIGIAVTVTILNPVQMAWQERLSELKLLNTIGISLKNIWKVGFCEFMLMVLITGFASSLVLFIVLGIQSYTGLDFSSINQGAYIERGGIIMPRLIYPRFDLFQIMGIFGAISLIYGSSYIYAIHNVLKRLRSSEEKLVGNKAQVLNASVSGEVAS